MPRTPTADPTAIDASLHLLAHQIVEALARDSLEQCLLHVTPETDGIALGIKPLEDLHPSSLLLGFVAPPEWHALGVACSGSAYHVADRATGAPAKHRIHLVALVSRSGEIATSTRVDGDADTGRALDEPAGSPEGEQIDLLRLALELPTAPPPCDVSVFWAIEWLTAILDRDEPATSWHEIRGESVAAVPDLDGSWSRLRQLVIDEVVSVPHLVPADARWLDDGAFARFVLSRCRPLSTLRRQVRDALPDDLARRLDETLDDLDIPETAWPDDILE